MTYESSTDQANPPLLSDLRYLLSTASRRDRRLLVVNATSQFVLGMLDLIGVASILPLMQILMGSPIDDGMLGILHRLLGRPSERTFVIMVAACMILAFVLKSALAMALMWWTSGHLSRLQTATSRQLLTVYLSESLLEHRRRNTGELIRTVGPAVNDAYSRVLAGALSTISILMSMTLIVGLLFAVAPMPTAIALAYFGGIVLALQRVLAPANRQAGKEAQRTVWIASHALLDAMAGFREAILHNARIFFVDQYDEANITCVRASRKANFLGGLPKYVLELVTMVGLTIFIVISTLGGTAKSSLPVLSLFVAATIKLLPMMVSLTAALGTIRVGREGLHITVDALRTDGQIEGEDSMHGGPSFDGDTAAIKVDGVSFRYPDAERDVLNDVTIHIPPGQSLALCGVSGSGKTTLVDIILGLISPTRGCVTYGNVRTDTADDRWHDVVAYVPQDVFIMSGTIASNVAFGVRQEDQDRDQIIRSIERAALGDLLADMPDGIDTLVGERGSRLSGGQRQRLGIARALYRNPKVIVLDEATSALDNETEFRIGRTVEALRGDITTIVVAHRLSTVRDVDQLVFLEGGSIAAKGSFGHVVESAPAFARLVALGRLDSDLDTSRAS